ncbi:Sec63 Brl domain-domain-containing protein [Yarrowia lipolytica]|uniref:Sec63 Brl domain-domain-containing protein n=1 Tax=Yarrowia lipolytica TaxID=4952 RepID=A0A371C4W9_YARLL|nr:Sec63 Brl domain-domain-containing protein [Yarrowia lipolytica]
MSNNNDMSRYKYEEMSSIVVQADRRHINRESGEDKAIPESLVGKINVKDMGSGVRREVPDAGVRQQQEKMARKERMTSKPTSVYSSSGLYTPQMPQTREAFELLMAWTGRVLGDVSHETICAVTDELIATLRDEKLQDKQRQKEIESIVGKLSNTDFNQAMSLAARLTDYAENQDEEMADDGESGVAVVFDGSDDEDAMDLSEDDEDLSDMDGDYVRRVPVAQREGEDEEDMDVEQTVVEAAKESDSDVIPATEIDSFWLQREIASLVGGDQQESIDLSRRVFDILAGESSLRETENELSEAFDFDHLDFVAKLCHNRDRVVWITRLQRADGPEKDTVKKQMTSLGLASLVSELHGETETSEDVDMDVTEDASQTYVPRYIDTQSLVFDQGARLLTSSKVKLPANTTKHSTSQYEEFVIPAPERAIPDANEKVVSIADMPSWTHVGFSDTKSLNRIQSKVFPCAFESDDNMLICAPTGAGKTNVAFLAMLRCLSHFRAPNGGFRTNDFKMVYIAPLKALVQEQVREFSKRLNSMGLKVSELTGDHNLTKQQIAETQLLVTTPEKWDVITRKAADSSYTNLVRLIVIDEIHLLHDERGPVLESIVARTTRRSEQTGDPVRIVGLSATLPNFKDVSSFLRVGETGLFYFDSTFRPCPLGQRFLGITEKKAFKRYTAMNDACFDKVIENIKAGHQVIVFVHSRKETAKTARMLRDRAMDEGLLPLFCASDGSRRTLAERAQDPELDATQKEIIGTGLATHHAGLAQVDRKAAEELFAEGHVRVLVSTATLAWGVNLPAHTVIIKGTQIYNPAKGQWTELSPQDVLQMLGRAGRPRYDDSGEGIIITTHGELNYYLSLMNQQLPIESQLMSRLEDSLNAEVVGGTVSSVGDGIQWLGYTYLYVRMLVSPGIYLVGSNPDDAALTNRRADLVHSALSNLAKSGLVIYDTKTGRVRANDLGRVAAHYYITHSSMRTYRISLKPHFSIVELFQVFSASEEFKYVGVRQEEKLELGKLLESAPIPVRESVEDSTAKINVLLQAFISRLSLEGFALVSDMIYVTQSAQRLFRAIYEFCLRKKWARLARITLDVCKMVEQRLWLSSCPLRQFPDCPAEVAKKIEASAMPWKRYLSLENAEQVGEAIRTPRYGTPVFRMLQKFPQLKLSARALPVTASLVRLEIEVEPSFEWDVSIHHGSEPFALTVEDGDGEKILYSDSWTLRRDYATETHLIEVSVTVADPRPPHLFVTLSSERWLHADARLAVPLRNIVFPGKFPAPTQLIDLQPVPVVELKRADCAGLYDFSFFNKIQSQLFRPLVEGDGSVFVGAPPGSGKTVLAELALLRLWNEDADAKTVYMAPTQAQVDARYDDWSQRMNEIHGGKTFSKLSGELAADLRKLATSDVVLATPNQWDSLSRRWQKRAAVRAVSLFIADDVHLVGGDGTYETVVSRMRYIDVQLQESGAGRPLRIVGLGVPVADGVDMAGWLDATPYNFKPWTASPTNIHIQSLSIPHHPSLMQAFLRPTYNAILELAPPKHSQTVIFVDSRRTLVDVTIGLSTIADEQVLVPPVPEDSNLELAMAQVTDNTLKEAIQSGIGHLYPSMSSRDRKIVLALYAEQSISTIIATREECWTSPRSQLSVILGTQTYEGSEHRYVNYPISTVLQMIGQASNDALVLTPAAAKDYYLRFLNDSLPVESNLGASLHDALLAEICEKVIESMDDTVAWLTYTYLYRRLHANPGFYGVPDRSDDALNVYLSELAETTVEQLVEAKMVEMDDEGGLEPLNAASIASYYNVSFDTMATLTSALSPKSKYRSILQAVTTAAEFDSLPIRNHEDILLRRLYGHIPWKLPELDSAVLLTPAFKAFVLAQCHIARLNLPSELTADQAEVVQLLPTLLAASVDLLASEGHQSCMYAMDLSQMVVQATLESDSPLRQVPFFTPEIIDDLRGAGVEAVGDISELDEDKLKGILNFTAKQLKRVIDFVDAYPSIQLSYELADSYATNDVGTIEVTVERDVYEEDERANLEVVAPLFPQPKTENWWIVVGNTKTKQIFGIKRVTLPLESQTFNIDVSFPEHGEVSGHVWCICDSYVDADAEKKFTVTVAEGEEAEEVEMEE